MSCICIRHQYSLIGLKMSELNSDGVRDSVVYVYVLYLLCARASHDGDDRTKGREKEQNINIRGK